MPKLPNTTNQVNRKLRSDLLITCILSATISASAQPTQPKKLVQQANETKSTTIQKSSNLSKTKTKYQDRDGDFVEDNVDKCPEEYGVNENDGCLPGMKLQFTLIGHTQQISSLDFSPTEDIIASGGFDNKVKVWNTNTGKCLHTFEMLKNGYTDWIRSVNFSPDGKKLAAGGYDGMVKIWEVNSGELVDSFKVSEQISDCKWSKDGKYIVVIGWFDMVQIWSSDAKLIKIVSGNSNDTKTKSSGWSNTAKDLQVSNYFPLMYYCNEDGSLFQLDLEKLITEKISGGFKRLYKSGIPDTKLTTSSDELIVKIFSITSEIKDKRYNLSEGGGTITSLVSCSSSIYVAKSNGLLLLFDIRTGTILQKTNAYPTRISSISKSRNDLQLAIGGFDNTIKIFSLK